MTRHSDAPLSYLEVVPSGAAKPGLPLVVVLHGRGADSNDLADLAPAVAAGLDYRFVLPDAPRPFEPMPGYKFGYSWFTGWPPEPKSFHESRDRLTSFMDEIFRRYAVDPSKTVLTGFSQGGMMALDVGLRIEPALAGIICMSGAINEHDPPPFRKDVPILIVHGTEDEMIPVVGARRTRQILERNGIVPDYHEFAMGHSVSEESLRAVTEFVHRVLD